MPHHFVWQMSMALPPPLSPGLFPLCVKVGIEMGTGYEAVSTLVPLGALCIQIEGALRPQVERTIKNITIVIQFSASLDSLYSRCRISVDAEVQCICHIHYCSTM